MYLLKLLLKDLKNKVHVEKIKLTKDKVKMNFTVQIKHMLREFYSLPNKQTILQSK